MMVLQTNTNANIFEIDPSLFTEVKEFLTNLSKKKEKSFSYIDDIGDTVNVINGVEYIAPTRDDLSAIYSSKEDDFISETQMKQYFNVFTKY